MTQKTIYAEESKNQSNCEYRKDSKDSDSNSEIKRKKSKSKNPFKKTMKGFLKDCDSFALNEKMSYVYQPFVYMYNELVYMYNGVLYNLVYVCKLLYAFLCKIGKVIVTSFKKYLMAIDVYRNQYSYEYYEREEARKIIEFIMIALTVTVPVTIFLLYKYLGVPGLISKYCLAYSDVRGCVSYDDNFYIVSRLLLAGATGMGVVVNTALFYVIMYPEIATVVSLVSCIVYMTPYIVM